MSLWTFECDSAMYGGEHINSTMPYRIQHVITGRCFFGGMEESKGESSEGDDTWVGTNHDYLQSPAEWVLKPYNAVRKEIYRNGQIQLVSSKGLYICAAEASIEGKPGCYGAFSSGFASDRDALVVSIPDSTIMQILNKVKECKRRIIDSVQRIKQAFASSGSYSKAMQSEIPVLISIYSFMTLNCTIGAGTDPFTKTGPPAENWQDMFGEQALMNDTFEIIETVFGLPEGEEPTDPAAVYLKVPMSAVEENKLGKQAVPCFMLMFQFIKKLVTRNPTNQRSLAAYISILNRFLPYKFQVVDTLAELYTGNRAVLTSIGDDDLRALIQILKTKHESNSSGARFVDLLRNICACDGVPIAENQNRVLDFFVMDKNLQLQVEYRNTLTGQVSSPGSKVKGGESVTYICDVVHGGEWIPLTNFCGKTTAILAKPINECTLEEKIYRYHIQSMRLYVALCDGRNRWATDYLLSEAGRFGLAYKDLLGCLKNSVIPPAYRAIIAEVIVALYIDREPNETISAIQMIHIWSDVKPEKELERQMIDPFANFPDLRPPPGFTDFKEYLLSFLTSSPNLDWKDPNNAKLQGCMILMTKLLLEFGFYHNDDGTADLQQCSILIDPLLDWLDGRSDGSYPERCQYGQETMAIFESKFNICNIMEFIFDCRQDKRLRITFDAYENAMNQALKQKSYDGIDGPGPWDDATLTALEDNLFNKPLISKKVAMGKDMVTNPTTFIQVLLDCTRYESPQLVVKSISLLNRHFGQRSAMVKTMQRLQIVVFPEVAQLVGEVRIHVSEMRRNKKWLQSRDVESRNKGMVTVTGILERWCGLLELHNEVIIGDKTITIAGEEISKFQSMLEKQGALDKVLDILMLPRENAGSEMYEIFLHVYDFLTLFCEGNAYNQKALFDKRHLFLEHTNVEKSDDILSHCAGKLMSSIVTDNKLLLESIEESLYGQIFKYLNHLQNDPEKEAVPPWLDFLSALCQFNGQRHARNAAQVMKRIGAYPDLIDTYSGVDGLQRLMTALTEQDMAALDWHLAGMRLLATCCLDRSPDAEVKAQSAVSWRSICSRMLCLEELPTVWPEGDDPMELDEWKAMILEVKTVYVDFMTNVYLNSETEIAKITINSVGDRIWPDEAELEVHILMQRWYTTLCQRRVGANLTKSRALNPRTVIHECVGGLHELWRLIKAIDGIEIKSKKRSQSPMDLLEGVVPVDIAEARTYSSYVCNHLVPMLHAYYKNYYRADGSTHIQQQITRTVMRLLGHILRGSLLDAEARKKIMSLVVLLETHEFPFEGEEVIEPESKGPSDKALFKSGFQHYLQDVARQLKIKDLKRSIGVGIKNLARMMCQDQIPGMESVFTYREVIYRIFTMLHDRPDGLKHELVTDMLRMTRAIVYMDDPLDEEDAAQDSSWDDFMQDRPPVKSKPQREVIEWVQSKVATLGGIVAAGENIKHPSATVSIAALRLGITLLESGNKKAQALLRKNLVETQNDEFFQAFEEYLSKACTTIKEWRTHLKKKALAEQLRTRRGSEKSTASATGPTAPDSEEENAMTVLNETSLALRFLQLTMEGHYEPFQDLLREQESNRVSFNLLNSATELLIVIEASLQFCFDNQYGNLLPLTIQLCEFMTESVQGSCFLNQLDLSSNQSSMLYDRIFKVCTFSKDPEADDTIIPFGDPKKEQYVTIRTAKCLIRSAMTTTVVSILEDNYDETLGTRLLSNIDANACVEHIGNIWDGWDDDRGGVAGEIVLQQVAGCETSGDYDIGEQEIMDHGFQTYALLKYLQDRENPAKPDLIYTAMKLFRDRPLAKAECDEWTTSIEVARPHWTKASDSDPTCQMRVHFTIPDFCLQVQKRAVFQLHCEEKIMGIPRENPVEKVLKLLGVLNTLTGDGPYVRACDWIGLAGLHPDPGAGGVLGPDPG